MRVITTLAFALGFSLSVAAAEAVKQTVNVLDLIRSGAVEYHVNPKMDFHDEPAAIWSFLPDGTFKASGRGYGYVVTKDSYRDYHLVLEFKWGEKTYGKRENAARDNGILLHAYGPHGAYADTWMASIECQIIEGGTGDILVLSPKLPDGTELTTSLTAEYALDRDKEKIWKPGSPRQLVTKGRINWEHRDEDWADKRGFRGAHDVDSPSGEWNRLEVIARGDTLQYFVNGVKVNEAFDCKPSEGRLCLQTEGAEMLVRRYELHPLDSFKEKWSAIQASGGSQIDVLEARTTAWTPEQSLAAIELDGPYEAQLVASEPFVRDPVEVTWDAQGRFYVADMMDYPLGDPSGSAKHLSRIQQLIDDNGDGRMDRAITFADDMDFVQGLLPYRDGLIATTRTAILWLKDTNGDGIADTREPLIKGFNPKHAQLQVSAPRWGLDGCVYFCNGLDSKEIYPSETFPVSRFPLPVENQGASVAPTENGQRTTENVTRTNFRWDPATNAIEPVSGFGQFGGAFDDWGHHFSCSNRSPVMFAVMPYEAVIRNPHAGITEGWENIAPHGAESRVYPLIRSHTTADAHAGTYTAACGLGVYRGDLMPELKNNVFTCDPTGQLVSRYVIEPNGASLKALKQGDHTEFFRSRDEWTRPVSMTYGPDGAIYICDMYRQYIDHARFFPEEFVRTHDMRKGENEGRIWRIVPKGARYAADKATAMSQPRASLGEHSLPGCSDEHPCESPSVSSLNQSPRPATLIREDQLAGYRPNEDSEPRLAGSSSQRPGRPCSPMLAPSAGPAKGKRSIAAAKPIIIRPITPAPKDVPGLVAWLGHENAWQRETAQRLLVERQDKAALPELNASLKNAPKVVGKLQTLGTLIRLGAANEAKSWIHDQLELARERQIALKDSHAGLSNEENHRLAAALELARPGLVGSNVDCPQSTALIQGRLGFMGILNFVYGCPADIELLHSGKRDTWRDRALLVAAEKLTGLLIWKTADRFYAANPSPEGGNAVLESGFLRSLALQCTALGDTADFNYLMLSLQLAPGQLTWWKPALLQGLAEGLPKSGGKLGFKSLPELLAEPPAEYAAAAKEITSLLALADKTIADASAPLDQRLAVMPLLAQRKAAEAEPVLRSLLAADQPAELQAAAMAVVKQLGVKKLAPLLYELLPTLGPGPKREVFTMLISSNPSEVFAKMERGEMSKSLADAETRWRFLKASTPELRATAERVFGKPSEDRAAVIKDYSSALSLKGDSKRGHEVFKTICFTCHKVRGEGFDVGPDITDVRTKAPEALLSDILDPNRMCEARWSAYQVDTKDGKTLVGLIASESANGVTLKGPGLNEEVARSNVAKVTSLDRTLMPPGLEGAINKQQMADLLAFLRGE